MKLRSLIFALFVHSTPIALATKISVIKIPTKKTLSNRLNKYPPIKNIEPFFLQTFESFEDQEISTEQLNHSLNDLLIRYHQEKTKREDFKGLDEDTLECLTLVIHKHTVPTILKDLKPIRKLLLHILISPNNPE